MATLFLETPYDKGCCWHLVRMLDEPVRRSEAVQISEEAASHLHMRCGLPVHSDRRWGPFPPMPEINREDIEARLAKGDFRIPKKAAKWLGVQLPEKK